MIRVGTFDELRTEGVIVVSGSRRRIAVFADGDDVFAVENNCPHMGFPLDKGSVQNGILTCHWHQARFDLRSGCTFDLWADDVPRHRVERRGDEIFVDPDPAVTLDLEKEQARLMRGVEQNVALVQAKSILALLERDVPIAEIIRPVVAFAGENLSMMSEGLTRLTCVARLFPNLAPETAHLALYYAVRQIAQETNRSVPRRDRTPLDTDDHDLETLRGWLNQWVQTRHQDAAERTLLTGIESLDAQSLATLLFSAATVRMYAAGGHHLEDCNKILELAEILGSAELRHLLPLVTNRMAESRGQEESTNWHHPVQIVAPLRELESRLDRCLALPRRDDWRADDEFAAILLGDDPLAILETIEVALAEGAPAPLIAREVAFAAATRLARFATSNEVTDWFNPQHTFIYANGIYQATLRSSDPLVVRGVLHGAISVYMDRFLNVPATPLPSERKQAAQEGSLRGLVDLLDQRANLEEVADCAAGYLKGGNDFTALVDRLTFATVREDLDFHSLQVLEASVNQCTAWDHDPARVEVIITGAVRNLAAHCPTRRAGQQTATIARRLHRGEKIFEEA